jgi:A/G-specific adenine glycosylase
VDWFATELLRWYDCHGRKDLPWQQQPSPYRVWVSEIMLQQTQVATVIPYFQRFTARFPDVATLAHAPLDDVLHHWTGLGYYARARNLQRAAGVIVTAHSGELPRTLDALTALPGIGRSTAGAILALAHGIRAPILDGNVKRVLARFHAEHGHAGENRWISALWQHAETHTPDTRLQAYTQAVMDLGALVCVRRRPRCTECPLATRCQALAHGLTTQLPAPRPRRTLPVRQVRMFVIEDDAGRVLLEQRPPTGLWGGLYGPPERTSDYPAEQLLRELGLIAPNAPTFSPTIGAGMRHTFTHFHMDIEPVYLRVPWASATVRNDARWRWYDRAGAEPIGLSAAAIKLLARTRSTEEP